MKLTSKKYYPVLLIVLYSLLGMTIPAAVSQFTMSATEIANTMKVSEQTILSAETVRASCLVVSMFLSNVIYRRLGLKRTIALGISFQIIPQFILPTAINAGSVPLLFLLKGMQGCNSIAFPLYISAILMWVDDAYAGFSTAFFNGSFIAGNGLGGWLTARLIPGFGWQPSFYIIGVFCIIFALPAIIVTEENEERKKRINNKSKSEKGSYVKIAKMAATWAVILASLSSSWTSQAVMVDLPLYSSYLKYNYSQSGNLMFLISIITVVTSIIAGLVSDKLYVISKKKFRSRCLVLSFGYIIAAFASVILPMAADKGFIIYSAFAGLIVAGSSWASGALWPVINYVYPPEDAVAGTSFCSSASTISNPIAPFVTGVVLGSVGKWQTAWWIAAIISVISFISCMVLFKKYDYKC